METYFVNIAEYKVCHYPDRPYSIGLGSCIGLTLYDPATRVGGLLHILLPSCEGFDPQKNSPTKFADSGVRVFYDAMIKAGARKGNLQAKMAGGAMMFPIKNGGHTQAAAVGERNIEACKRALKELGIRLVAEDTGGTKGRTVELNTENGALKIKIIQEGEKTI